MRVIQMKDLDLRNKRVLIREDLNVPIADGTVKSDARLKAAIPSIDAALKQGAGVLLMSHLGRPEEGVYDEAFSMKPVARRLGELMGRTIPVVKDYLDGVSVAPGDVALLENVRFLKGEKKDDETLGKRYAALCDVFVMDAFGTAHRAQATTSAVAKFAPQACAGPLLAAELAALDAAMANPKRPLLAIIGGSKVSTKLTVLKNLLGKVNIMIVGGGIANNFLLDSGYSVGASLCEKDLAGEAEAIMQQGAKQNVIVPIPTDVITAPSLNEPEKATTKSVMDVQPDDMILDIGPNTAESYQRMIMAAGTVIWNGPVGAFETDAFGHGTKAICEAIAATSAYTLVGGGDSLAAMEKYGCSDKASYLSTGGGAFLEFLEGKTLPAVAVLEARATECK